jgi:hypothetical protein
MSNNVIQFPNPRQRIGSKHRQAEIEMLQRHLLLVDEDMETVLNQLDCLNQDLIELKSEYDNLLKRLTKLLDQETKE